MGTPKDELIRTFPSGGSVALRVLCATQVVREAARRHETSLAASVALGRTLMGALLLASDAQDGEQLQIQVRGDGPLGSITVTADGRGCVRGFIQHPAANPTLGAEHLELSAAIGTGVLSVERNHPRWKQPYSGIVPLVSGEIADDLTRYLLESEQKPSALVLGVFLGSDGSIEAAGGYLIQSLPGAAESELREFEGRVAETSHPSALLHQGIPADGILARLLGSATAGEVQRVIPRFHCPCGPDRVRRAAVLLGRDEIREIVTAGEELEIRCAFCAEVYHLSPGALAGLLSGADGG